MIGNRAGQDLQGQRLRRGEESKPNRPRTKVGLNQKNPHDLPLLHRDETRLPALSFSLRSSRDESPPSPATSSRVPSLSIATVWNRCTPMRAISRPDSPRGTLHSCQVSHSSGGRPGRCRLLAPACRWGKSGKRASLRDRQPASSLPRIPSLAVLEDGRGIGTHRVTTPCIPTGFGIRPSRRRAAGGLPDNPPTAASPATRVDSPRTTR